jgi:predicted nucleotidyltransferase
MVRRDIIKILNEFSKSLDKEGIKVTKLILYGSYATGKFHKDSDIDVAVVSSDFGIDRFDEGTRLFRIACKIDPRIEPVPISLESYENDTWVPLIYEIKEKGFEI